LSFVLITIFITLLFVPPLLAQTPEITNGLNYLTSTQSPDGSWGNETSSTGTVPSTVAVIETLQELSETGSSNYSDATTWLSNQALETTDNLSQRIHALSDGGTDLDTVIAYLDDLTSAWGGYSEYGVNVYDTTRALLALKAVQYADLYAIGYSLGYLSLSQNPNGGWGFTEGSDSNTFITANVLKVLLSYRQTFDLSAEINSAVSYLLTKQNIDGGFGSSPSTVYDTAHVLDALLESGADVSTSIPEAIDYLTTTQQANGSWNDDPYSTALALRTLAQVKPNLTIDVNSISYFPTVPTLGDAIQINAAISNNGLVKADNILVGFYDGDPNEGGSLIGETSIQTVQQGSSESVLISWVASNPGLYNIFITVDPADNLAEVDETDNIAIRQIRIYDKVDLLIQAMTFIPDLPSPGQPVNVHVKIQNEGGLATSGVVVRLSVDRVPIQDSVIESLASMETQTVQLTLQDLSNGVHQITAMVDPDDIIVEGDELNNTFTGSIEIKERIDLVATGSGIYLSNANLNEGEVVQISANVFNGRENGATDVVVRFYDGNPDDGGTIIGEDQIIPSVPGKGSAQTGPIAYDTSGRPGRHTITLVVDPLNSIEETNELNNTSVNAFEVTPLSDLIVQDIIFAPASAEEGDIVQLKAIVENIGSVRSDSVKLKFFLGDPSSGGEQIGSDIAVNALNEGLAYTTIATSFNTSGKVGENQVYAIVDAFGTLNEIRETNNSMSKVFTVQQSTRPDLAVASSGIVFSPENPVFGQPLTITADVDNLKNTPIANVSVRFYDGDPAVDGVLIGDAAIASMPGMSSSKVNYTLDPASIEGVHTIYVLLDPENTIQETNEENNEAYRDIKIGLPGSAAPQNLSATPASANSIQLTWEPGPDAEAFGIVGYNIYRNNILVNKAYEIAGEGTASASSANGSNNAGRALDRQRGTYWYTASNAALPQWWLENFSSERQIKRVIIFWHSIYFATDYELQTWDGSQWNTQLSVTGNSQSVTIHDLPVSTATQGLRIFITQGNKAIYPGAIAEVYMYEDNCIYSPNYEDSGLGEGDYEYFATAVNGSGIETLPSNTAIASLGDVTSPATPTGLLTLVDGFDVHLTWDPNTESDLAGYRVYRDDLNVAHKGRGAIIVGSNGISHDNIIDGNVSTYGYTYWDSDTPGTLTVILNKIYEISRIRMLLREAANDSFYRYKIEASQDGQIWQTVSERTSGQWRGWQEEIFSSKLKVRYFRVTGTFASLNRNFSVVEFEAYAADIAPDTLDKVNTLSVSVSNYANDYQYTFDWNAASEQPRRFVFKEFDTRTNDVLYIYNKETGALLAVYSGNLGSFITRPLKAQMYRFHFVSDYEGTASGFKCTHYILQGSQTSTEFDETIYKAGNYRFAVTAIDTSGNESGLSELRTASIEDLTPPSTPKNFSAVAGNGVIDLMWTSNIEPDLAGYNLYRDGSVTPLNGSVLISSSEYSDSQVINLTTYSYEVTAVDVNGNESPRSAPVIATPTGIDLAVSVDDLSFRPRFPSVFDDIFIYAAVHNDGTDLLDGPVPVVFYVGDPSAGGIEIGSMDVQSLSPGEVTLLTFIWRPTGYVGTNTIFVKIGDGDSVAELVYENNSASIEITVNPEPELEVAVASVDASNYPEINVYARVGDWSGDGIFDLTEENFIVREDDIKETPITVTLLNSPGHKPLVDIVFVFDDTGSMGGKISGLKLKVNDFMNGLMMSDLDYVLGLVTFKDNYEIYNGGYLTGNDDAFMSWINGLSAGGGGDGPEDSLDALEAAMTMQFRPETQKVFVLITDAAPHVLGDGTSYSTNTVEGIVQRLQDSDVVTFVIGPSTYSGYGTLEGTYFGEGSISGATGGKYYNIYDNFSSIVDDLAVEIASLMADYRITYTTHNPARDGTLRNVDVEATYRYIPGSGEGQYVAPLDESSDLTVKSVSLSNEFPLSNEDVMITAVINNLGGIGAQNVLVRFYDGDPSYGVQLGGDQSIPALLPGMNVSVTTGWFATSGTHELYVIVDPLNTEAESNEANNVMIRTVSVPGTRFPDLSVIQGDITFSNDHPNKGDRVTVNAVVHNTGSEASEVLVLTYAGDPHSGGRQIGSAIISSFAANSTALVQTLLPDDLNSGTEDIYIWIDPYDTIREGNEGNNTAFNTVSFFEKDISVLVETDHLKYTANADVGITVFVNNHNPSHWSGTGDLYIEDMMGHQIDHVAIFTIEDLQPSGLSGWAHRIPVKLIAPWDLNDTLATTTIDFEGALLNLGITGRSIDQNSIRVLEFDGAGYLVGEKLAQSLFETAEVASITWLIDGSTSKGSVRHFYVYFDISENGNKEPSSYSHLPKTGKLIAYGDERGNISVIEKNSDGTFEFPVLIGDVSSSTNDYTRGIALDDFNGDGFVDIITGSGATGEIYYYQNQADGTNSFSAKMTVGVITSGNYVMDMAVADFNEDENKDFVVSGYSNNLMYLFTGNGDGTFLVTLMTPPTGVHYFRGKSAGDVNGDSNIDLVVGDNYGNIYVYTGNGDGTFNDPQKIADVGNDSYGVATGDFNEDGMVDIIANNGSSGDSYLLAGIGDGTFGEKVFIDSLDTGNYTAFDVGDFDNDGHLDILAITYNKKTVDLYYGKGDGTFDQNVTIATTDNAALGISASSTLPEIHAIPELPELVPFETLDFIWNTGSTPPGDYKVHVTLSESQGVIAEDNAPFEIVPDINISSAIAADKIAYNANETVELTSAITSLSANTYLEGLTARVFITSPDSQLLYTETSALPLLTKGQRTELRTYWNTGQQVPGIYTAELEVLQNGTLLVTSATSFKVLSSQTTGQGIIGSLNVEVDPVNQGDDQTVNYTIVNTGNSDMPDLTAKVLIIDPLTSEVKAEHTVVNPLAAGGSMADVYTFSTSGMASGMYVAVLQAQTGEMSEPKTLASDSFEVEIRDTIPPVVTLISPSNGDCTATTVDISVTATDERSGIDKVEYRIDSGAWTAMIVSGTVPDRYDTIWTPIATDEGQHTITYRALDKAGNESDHITTSVTVDQTAPSVQIVQPATGSHLTSAFDIVASSTDNGCGLGTVEYRRDDGPWTGMTSDINTPDTYRVLWAPVLGDEGSHVITVRATDAVGNISGPVSVNITIEVLFGTVSADPDPVYQGRDETITWTVTNSSSEDILSLDMTVRIIDPDSDEVKESFTLTQAVTSGETVTGIQIVSTVNLEPKIYQVDLEANAATMPTPKTLATTTFEVRPGVEIGKTIPDVTNLLVWVNDGCHEYDNDDGDDCDHDGECDDDHQGNHHASALMRSGDNHGDDEEGHHDGDDGDDDDHNNQKKCIRLDLLEAILAQSARSYFMVFDKRDFQEEMRNPYYTDILILGDNHPLEDHYKDELTEQVFAGRGLVSSLYFEHGNQREDCYDDHHKGTGCANSLFGIRYSGKLSGNSHAVELLDSPVSTAGLITAQGTALRTEALDPLSVAAWILDGQDDSDDHHDNGHGNKSSGYNNDHNNDNDDNHNDNDQYPGIVLNGYGRGETVFFAFDPTMTLDDVNYGTIADLLTRSIAHVHKPQTDGTARPNSLVPVMITVTSLGGELDVRLNESYPDGVSIYDPVSGNWITDNPWSVDIHLMPDETRNVLYYVLIPESTGTYTFTTEAGYLDDGIFNGIEELSMDLVVESDSDTLAGEIVLDLRIPFLKGQEQARLRNAKKYIENTQLRGAFTLEAIEENIHDILKAIGAIQEICSIDNGCLAHGLSEKIPYWTIDRRGHGLQRDPDSQVCISSNRSILPVDLLRVLRHSLCGQQRDPYPAGKINTKERETGRKKARRRPGADEKGRRARSEQDAGQRSH